MRKWHHRAGVSAGTWASAVTVPGRNRLGALGGRGRERTQGGRTPGNESSHLDPGPPSLRAVLLSFKTDGTNGAGKCQLDNARRGQRHTRQPEAGLGIGVNWDCYYT